MVLCGDCRFYAPQSASQLQRPKSQHGKHLCLAHVQYWRSCCSPPCLPWTSVTKSFGKTQAGPVWRASCGTTALSCIERVPVHVLTSNVLTMCPEYTADAGTLPCFFDKEMSLQKSSCKPARLSTSMARTKRKANTRRESSSTTHGRYPPDRGLVAEHRGGAA